MVLMKGCFFNFNGNDVKSKNRGVFFVFQAPERCGGVLSNGQGEDAYLTCRCMYYNRGSDKRNTGPDISSSLFMYASFAYIPKRKISLFLLHCTLSFSCLS